MPRDDDTTEAYSEQSQTSKMKLFAEKGNSWKPLTIFAESYILDVSLGSEFASAICLKYVTCIQY